MKKIIDMSNVEKYINEIKDQNIHIVGLASSECSNIALFLDKHGVSSVTLHQGSNKEAARKAFDASHQALEGHEQYYEKLINLPYTYHFDKEYLEGIEDADIIFAPQSWNLYENNKALQKYKDKIKTITWLYFKLSPAKIIAITGTNGKTTTAFITHEVLKNHPTKKVWFAGNDRKNTQCLYDIENQSKDDLFLLEVSNRQLNLDLPKGPDIGALTNISKQHLSEYPNYEKYIETKQKITTTQNENQIFITTEGEFTSTTETKAKKIIIKKPYPIVEEDLQIQGEHNLQNGSIAYEIAKITGMKDPEIKKALHKFSGCEKRQHKIATKEGVTFIDDSASTSQDSTIVALKAFPNATFIMGGLPHEGCNIKEVVKNITQKNIMCIDSPIATLLQKEIDQEKINLEILPTLTEATKKAYELTEKKSEVVLSPCAQYYIYFQGKIDDATKFKEIIDSL